MFEKRWLLSVVVLVAIVLTGCAPKTPPPPPASAEATSPPTVAEATAVEKPTQAPVEPTQAQPGEAGRKVVRFIFTQEFDSLNPLYTNMWFSTITEQLWDQWAWEFDEKNEAFPVMVTEIPSIENGGISEDGTTITMKLRDDLVWSDGEPMTANDFVFTANMYTEPKNTVAAVYPYDQIDTIEASDNYTVVMKFKQPFAPWLGMLWHGVIPEHILRPVFEKDGTLDNAEWNLAPTVGNGPFVFAEWESGSFARFVRNEKYWGEKPKVDEIFIRFVPDDASQVAALKADDADLGVFISYSDIPALEEAGLTMITAASGYHEGWYFNLNPEKGHPALQDVRVRQALALGFDRFSLSKDLLLGKTVPAATYWDNSPYVDPTIQPYPYDPEQAKKLLDEAGWLDSNGDGVRDKDGVELVLKYGTTTREVRQDTQAVAQQQLGALGVKFELSNYDSDIFFSDYQNGGPAATGELDFFEYSTVPSGFPDPDSYDWLCSELPSDEKPGGVNWTGFCDKDLDALFMKQSTQVDFTERQKTFYEITKMLFDKAYWVGLWQDPDIWAIGSKLQNVKLSGTTPFFNCTKWDLTK